MPLINYVCACVCVGVYQSINLLLYIYLMLIMVSPFSNSFCSRKMINVGLLHGGGGGGIQIGLDGGVRLKRLNFWQKMITVIKDFHSTRNPCLRFCDHRQGFRMKKQNDFNYFCGILHLEFSL